MTALPLLLVLLAAAPVAWGAPPNVIVILADDLDRVANKAKPFFRYYAATLPHMRHEIDDLGVYKNEPWTDLEKTYAAQVTRLDADVGRLMARLKELGLDANTLVVVAGDNGSAFAPDSALGKRFDQSMGGTLRGFKRGLYEGGLRQAAIVRWPGRVPAGRVCADPWAFWDLLPTCADLLGVESPGTDGLSVLPLWTGGPAPPRACFYWELHEGKRVRRAVRFGDWKAVQNGPAAAVELYDLRADPAEANDLAATRPAEVARAVKLLASERTDHPDWPLAGQPPKN